MWWTVERVMNISSFRRSICDCLQLCGGHPALPRAPDLYEQHAAGMFHPVQDAAAHAAGVQQGGAAVCLHGCLKFGVVSGELCALVWCQLVGTVLT